MKLIDKIKQLEALGTPERKAQAFNRLVQSKFSAAEWKEAGKAYLGKYFPSAKKAQKAILEEVMEEDKAVFGEPLINKIMRLEKVKSLDEIERKFNMIKATATEWKEAGKAYNSTRYTSAKKAKEAILNALKAFRANLIANETV